MYHTLHPEASLHVGGARDPEPLRFGAHIEAVSQPKDTRGPPTRASNWSGQWGSNQWQKEWTGEEVSLSQKISGDELREVGLLARLALKHEDTEAAVRSDTSFMLYMNTRGITITRTLYDMAQDWRKLKEEGRLNQSLRVTLIIGLLAAMKEKMKTALREEIRPTLEKHKWITQSNPPAWAYMTWNAAKEEQEVDAQKPPLPHDQAERTVQRIFELISMEGLLMKFHATRPMVQTYKSEVLPFVLILSNRGNQALHNLFQTLCNNACLSLVGIRMRPDRMKRQPLAVRLSERASSLLDATNPYRDTRTEETEEPKEGENGQKGGGE